MHPMMHIVRYENVLFVFEPIRLLTAAVVIPSLLSVGQGGPTSTSCPSF